MSATVDITQGDASSGNVSVSGAQYVVGASFKTAGSLLGVTTVKFNINNSGGSPITAFQLAYAPVDPGPATPVAGSGTNQALNPSSGGAADIVGVANDPTNIGAGANASLTVNLHGKVARVDLLFVSPSGTTVNVPAVNVSTIPLPQSMQLPTVSIQGPNAQFAIAGPVTVPSTGAAVLVASVGVQGLTQIGLNGFVVSGAISDFVIAFATSLSGKSVTRFVASAGDFAVISDFLNNATAQPQSTAAGSGFYADMDLKGRFVRMDIYAKSVTANTTVSVEAAASGH